MKGMDMNTQVPVEPNKVDQNHKVDPTQVMLVHHPPEHFIKQGGQ